MKLALQRKLRSIRIGGLAVIALLVIAYWLLGTLSGGRVLGNYSVLTLVILCLILLEGTAYWWLKQRQLSRESPTLDSRLIPFIYVLDMLLLLAYPGALVVALLNDSIVDSMPDALIGGGIYLLSLAGFIHYFLVKLVRSDTDRVALTRRRQVTARFMRELHRSELRKKTQ